MSNTAMTAALWGPLTALLQVVMIDLVLAGDNAVAVGMAASGLPVAQRRKVILSGLGAAVVLRIGLALLATRLLGLIGLMFAGGLLLLWVCWKMWRELRAQAAARKTQTAAPAKTFAQAFLQIFIADLSMSLDNVLAVAGAALNHPMVLVFGLLLSIVLMGLAANAIARILHKMHWIAYVGVAIVFYVAVHMMWEGYRDTVIDLHKVGPYNAAAPDWLDIKPGEVAKHARPK
jgi:YjbE family integral membrane protein